MEKPENLALAMEKAEKKKLQIIAKKKRGVWQLIRMSFVMLGRKVNGKPTSVNVEVAKSLVGAMRPLHHITAASVEVPPQAEVEVETKLPEENFQDVITPPPSFPGYSNSDDGMTSRYMSAENLEELDASEEASADESPNLIDVQAEEFITRFYEQMRLQRLDSMNRYHAMIARSAR